MLSYIDDLSITMASDSHRGNIHCPQGIFTNISERGRKLRVSFSISKTTLLHWQTCSESCPHANPHIELYGLLFPPLKVFRWLGYWLFHALTSTHHFRHRLSLAQAVFSFVNAYPPPGRVSDQFSATASPKAFSSPYSPIGPISSPQTPTPLGARTASGIESNDGPLTPSSSPPSPSCLEKPASFPLPLTAGTKDA